MFLLIHHLTFPRDSYSEPISSQLSHHTLETSTEARKSRFSSYKSLGCSFDFFSSPSSSVLFFLFFFFQTGPQWGREGGKPEQMLHTHAAICCVKCAEGVWWSNCTKLKSDILFECYFSERELKIDEIWHLHKPTKKSHFQNQFPRSAAQLDKLTACNNKPMKLFIDWKKKQNKIFTVTQYTASSNTFTKWWELKDDDDKKCWRGPEHQSLTLPSVKSRCVFEISWNHHLNLYCKKKLYSFNTSSPNPHLLTTEFYSFCLFNLSLAH